MRALICLIIVVSFLVSSHDCIGTVQAAATEVNGIIYSDTTWSKTGSPYSLSGPIAISEGITLNIEPGTTINFNNHYIQVNGTLHARGSTSEKIAFNGGGQSAEIQFRNLSPSWNEDSTTGSIIENSVLTSVGIDINGTSPKIISNSVKGYIGCDYGSSVISNNDITGSSNCISIFKCSATVSNNVIHNKYIGIDITSDASIISGNIVIGGATGISVSGNGSGIISTNIVSGCNIGIDAGYFSTIEQNVIINNNIGISKSGSGVLILHNNIINNTIGIYTYKSATITYNNIYGNSEYNIRLDPQAHENVNATYNWWGTTDSQAISQQIYDKKNDFNLGTVNFTPFLNSPNPDAPTVPNDISSLTSSTPTAPNESPNATTSPDLSGPQAGVFGLDWVQFATLGLLTVIVVLLVVVVVFLRRRSVK